MTFEIEKFIEIDAAHRVPDHGSKCRSLHGHRYKVVAVVDGLLHREGAAKGMVIDFADVKDALLAEVHDTCDHGTIVYAHDTELLRVLRPMDDPEDGAIWDREVTAVQNGVNYALLCGGPDGSTKVFVTRCVPTAEELAHLWYDMVAPRLDTAGVRLTALRVWETPTSLATYSPKP